MSNEWPESETSISIADGKTYKAALNIHFTLAPL